MLNEVPLQVMRMCREYDKCASGVFYCYTGSF